LIVSPYYRGNVGYALHVRPPVGTFIVRPLCRLLAVCLLVAGCSAPGADLPPIPNPPPGAAYLLGPGDQIRIITFGEEQLTGEFRVSDSGTIALPLIGSIPASGRTTKDIEAEITQALKQGKLFRDPSVSVEITAYRPIFILGEVSKPGQFPYQPGMTVLTAVTVAGGFTYRAVKDTASIVRTEDGKAVEGRAGRMTFVQPGDVITIYERVF